MSELLYVLYYLLSGAPAPVSAASARAIDGPAPFAAGGSEFPSVFMPQNYNIYNIFRSLGD